MGSPEAKAAAYGDLGSIHSALGNHEQAVNCLEHQREIANELGDRVTTSDATSALGNVYQQMGDLESALKLHKMDLELCESIGMLSLQARACGNLGSVHESLKNYLEAVKFFEKQLSLSADRLTKAHACGALGNFFHSDNLGEIVISGIIPGRVFHQMNQTAQSINFLRQGLAIAQSLNKSEEEAKIRHQLGSF